jgi:hypothetical protein
VAALTRALAPFELTKAEKLQVVNLAPTEPVELYGVSNFLSTSFLYIFLAKPLIFIFTHWNFRGQRWRCPQIVEELEDRLGERMEDVLDVVRDTLLDAPTPLPAAASASDAAASSTDGLSAPNGHAATAPDAEPDADMDGVYELDPDVSFDDAGDGAGIEGDLEVEEE